MGLLDFFRRRGASEPGSSDVTAGGAEEPADERAHAAHAPVAGLPAEGPPVGTGDPGSLTGEDADEVAGRKAAEETDR